MYLILPSKEAEKRNCDEAKKRGCESDSTVCWWDCVASSDGKNVALIVDEGDGLTEEELEQCVKVLEEDF